MIIYKITNLLDGKVYIGQTIKPIYERIKAHKARLNKGDCNHYKLYGAMAKYGWDNFKFEVIDDSATTIEELDYLEKFYIDKFDSLNNGYNLAIGGRDNPMDSPQIQDNHKSKMQSPEVRTKISTTMKKRISEVGFSDEHRANLSKGSKLRYANGGKSPQFGKPISDEHKKALLESRLKKVWCEDEFGNVFKFDSVYEAAYWMIGERGIDSKAKSLCTRIKKSNKDKKPYHGLMWYYE